MEEKARGRRKRTERAKKWREWALTMRLDSLRTVKTVRGGDGVAMADRKVKKFEGFGIAGGRNQMTKKMMFCLSFSVFFRRRWFGLDWIGLDWIISMSLAGPGWAWKRGLIFFWVGLRRDAHTW